MSVSDDRKEWAEPFTRTVGPSVGPIESIPQDAVSREPASRMYGRRSVLGPIHRVAHRGHRVVWGIDVALAGRDSRGGETTVMTTKDLDEFFEAGWNGHDVDRLMTFMADDCVFESTTGPDACGTRHVGRERVREAFGRVFATYPDARFAGARHFVSGDRGLSEWLFTGTAGDGRKVEVNGCDVFTFRHGKIAVKSSFFKTRTGS
jgi:taurine dehydrogenase small subunit